MFRLPIAITFMMCAAGLARAEPPSVNASILDANRYFYGDGVAVDYARAFTLYLSASDAGNPDAQVKIGYFYSNNLVVPLDYPLAMTMFRRAAKNGNVAAEYYVGHMYEYGLGVPQDTLAALAWYRAAADHGDASAIARLKALSMRDTSPAAIESDGRDFSTSRSHCWDVGPPHGSGVMISARS